MVLVVLWLSPGDRNFVIKSTKFLRNRHSCKMQLFLELKKYFKTLGIERNQRNLFGIRNVIALILFTYCSCATVSFLLFEPNKTFFDLGNAFYGTVCFALNIITLLSNVMKQRKIFLLIENFEDLITKSKPSFFFKLGIHIWILACYFFLEIKDHSFEYDKVNEKIEKWSNITYTAFIKITWPFMYLPKFFLSYYNFFANHGSDSFVLNVPMLYV